MSEYEYRVMDISAYQRNVPYSKLYSLGISAAILRVVERYNVVDSMFDTHYKGLKKAGIPIPIVYKFSYAMNVYASQQEANAVVEVLKKYPDFHGAVCLDMEFQDQTILSKSTLTSIIEAFRKIVVAAGYDFLIYCNTNWYNNYLDTAKLPYSYWIASYPLVDTGAIVERLRPNCKGQVGWQYSSKFKINGEDYDMSVFDLKYIDDLVGDVEIFEASKDDDLVIIFDSGEKDVAVITPPDTGNDVIERAARWMEDTANDNSHGYDQIYRWNERGDYDCSSAVITAWETAGVPVKSNGATYTGNMYSVFTKLGFKDVTSSVNLSTGAGLVRGDVLLNHVHHTAMYIGNGREVEASINEKGTATYGTPGDQTGREFLIMNYRNYPWDCVLRYKGSGTSAATPSVPTPDNIIDSYPTIQQGSMGTYVVKLQKFLNQLGWDLVEDGDFGPKTRTAVTEFQKKYSLVVDGIVGQKTWTKLNEAINTKPEFPKTMTVKKSPGYIRRGMSKSYTIIYTIGKGDKVTALELKKNSSGQEWYKVRYQGRAGYMVATNLK